MDKCHVLNTAYKRLEALAVTAEQILNDHELREKFKLSALKYVVLSVLRCYAGQGLTVICVFGVLRSAHLIWEIECVTVKNLPKQMS